MIILVHGQSKLLRPQNIQLINRENKSFQKTERRVLCMYRLKLIKFDHTFFQSQLVNYGPTHEKSNILMIYVGNCVNLTTQCNDQPEHLHSSAALRSALDYLCIPLKQ